MAIVVIGAGAVGLLVAGRLAQAELPVALLVRPRAVDRLAAHGILINQEGRSSTPHHLAAAATVAALPAAFQRPALAIICVKSYDSVGTLPALDALRPEYVLTLQNGIGNEELLLEHLGAERVLSGVITSSVTMSASEGGPDTVTVTKNGGVGVAALVPANRDLAGNWATLFTQAGLAAQRYNDYRSMKWSKALLNMLANASAAILDLPVAAVYANDRLVALERRAFLEALATMRRLRIKPLNLPRYPAALLAHAMRNLPAPLLYPLLRRVVVGGRGGKAPSLLGDLQRGSRRSEGEALYGAVARAASEVGVPAPVNAGLWQLLNAIATGAQPWANYQQQPEQLLATVGLPQTPRSAHL